jgi:hypothetical protein
MIIAGKANAILIPPPKKARPISYTVDDVPKHSTAIENFDWEILWHISELSASPLV